MIKTLEIDLSRYRKVIQQVNDDSLAQRQEGRSTTVCGLILEGGLTFMPSAEVYHVAVFVCNYLEISRYKKIIVELVERGILRYDYYAPTIKIHTQRREIIIEDQHTYEKRIVIKFLVLNTLRQEEMIGRSFHNYFVDISEDDFYRSNLFAAIPFIQTRLRDKITR